MFNSLRGKITAKLSDVIYLDNAGIEWEIFLPSTDVAALPGIGTEARVFTWLLHREDSMRIYGFADETRRATFLELQKVEGIGPKQALKILGGIAQEELEKALEAGDLARLEAVPGLGKKTAQKMVLALKGRLVKEADIAAVPTAHEELVDSLCSMGYDKKAVLTALERASRELGPELSTKGMAEKEKLLFKQAIILLSGA